VLHKPEDWMAKRANKPFKPVIFVMDMIDHFIFAVTCIINGENTVVAFNTISESFTKDPAMVAAFDFMFPV
jgi:hypothetical protein